MLRLRNVVKSYTNGRNKTVVLNDVNLDFKKNELVFILGTSLDLVLLIVLPLRFSISLNTSAAIDFGLLYSAYELPFSNSWARRF